MINFSRPQSFFLWHLIYIWNNRTPAINTLIIFVAFFYFSIIYGLKQLDDLNEITENNKQLNQQIKEKQIEEVNNKLPDQNTFIGDFPYTSFLHKKLELIRTIAKKNNILISSAQYEWENKGDTELLVLRINQELVANYPKIRGYLSDMQQNDISIRSALMQRSSIKKELINTTVVFLIYFNSSK